MRTLLLAALLTGCAHVNQDDLNSWAGAPTCALQMHQVFSTMPKRVEALDGGRELWTYSNCSHPVGGDPETVRYAPDVCCHNQFVVNGQTVESYRTIGSCRTDYSVRPVGCR